MTVVFKRPFITVILSLLIASCLISCIQGFGADIKQANLEQRQTFYWDQVSQSIGDGYHLKHKASIEQQCISLLKPKSLDRCLGNIKQDIIFEPHLFTCDSKAQKRYRHVNKPQVLQELQGYSLDDEEDINICPYYIPGRCRFKAGEGQEQVLQHIGDFQAKQILHEQPTQNNVITTQPVNQGFSSQSFSSYLQSIIQCLITLLANNSEVALAIVISFLMLVGVWRGELNDVQQYLFAGSIPSSSYRLQEESANQKKQKRKPFEKIKKKQHKYTQSVNKASVSSTQLFVQIIQKLGFKGPSSGDNDSLTNSKTLISQEQNMLAQCKSTCKNSSSKKHLDLKDINIQEKLVINDVKKEDQMVVQKTELESQKTAAKQKCSGNTLYIQNIQQKQTCKASQVGKVTLQDKHRESDLSQQSRMPLVNLQQDDASWKEVTIQKQSHSKKCSSEKKQKQQPTGMYESCISQNSCNNYLPSNKQSRGTEDRQEFQQLINQSFSSKNNQQIDDTTQFEELKVKVLPHDQNQADVLDQSLGENRKANNLEDAWRGIENILNSNQNSPLIQSCILEQQSDLSEYTNASLNSQSSNDVSLLKSVTSVQALFAPTEFPKLYQHSNKLQDNTSLKAQKSQNQLQKLFSKDNNCLSNIQEFTYVDQHNQEASCIGQYAFEETHLQNNFQQDQSFDRLTTFPPQQLQSCSPLKLDPTTINQQQYFTNINSIHYFSNNQQQQGIFQSYQFVDNQHNQQIIEQCDNFNQKRESMQMPTDSCVSQEIADQSQAQATSNFNNEISKEDLIKVEQFVIQDQIGEYNPFYDYRTKFACN